MMTISTTPQCFVGRQNRAPYFPYAVLLQDVISRVQELDKAGQISGVMDDRGKVSNAAEVGTHCWCHSNV